MARVSLECWLAGSVRTMLKRIDMFEKELNELKSGSKLQPNVDELKSKVFSHVPKKVRFSDVVCPWQRLRTLCDEMLTPLLREARDDTTSEVNSVVLGDIDEFLDSMRVSPTTVPLLSFNNIMQKKVPETITKDFQFNASAAEFMPNSPCVDEDFQELCAKEPYIADAADRAAISGCAVPFRRLMGLDELFGIDPMKMVDALEENGGLFRKARSVLLAKKAAGAMDWDD